MTDKLRAAAEMALEALRNAYDASLNGDSKGCQWIVHEQITALRQALAEPPKWVHLLTDEKEDIRNAVGYSQFMSAEEYACKVQDATEAKLKELNHD